jgi:NhaP-type Na+/H+ or K+/H+ antiporter
MPARRPFFETLVQLIIRVVFVSISATVTPESVRHLVLPTLGLVAVLVVLTRSLVAFIATIRTGGSLWMPEGIQSGSPFGRR